jgi:WD40 repeat protein
VAAISALVFILAAELRGRAQSATPAESVVQLPARVVWFVVATGRPLAAAMTVDNKIRVLSLPEGREQRAFDRPPASVDVFSISPDGRFVVYGGHKGDVHVWSSTTGATQCELHLKRYPGVGVFSYDGATLAVAAQGDALQLVDVASCKTRVSLRQTVGGVMAAAFSRDGRYIATADGDTAVRVYEAGNARLVSENKDSVMSPLAVDFTPDGRTVLASGGDKVVLFVDAATGRTSRRASTTQPPLAMLISPDGKSLATVFMKSEDMTQPDHITVTSVASGTREADWLPPVMPIGGGWTVDGRFLVATAAQNTLHLWTLK